MSHKKKSKFPLIVKMASEALKRAVAKTIRDHKREGIPLVVWQDGKVVHIPASKLKVPRIKPLSRKAA